MLVQMIIDFIEALFWIYMIMLFVRIMGSWFPEWSDSPLIRFLAHYTDPYLDVFRRIIPPIGMLDLSPIVAFLFLNVLEVLLKQLVSWLL